MSDRIALLVDITLNPGMKPAFLERVRTHAALCLEREPGCLSFSVLDPENGGDIVHLCEIYRDAAAIDAHLSSEHMARYLEDTKPMIADRLRRRCTVVA